ncbi:MAG: M48 family metalloprotease [Myxococcales bacterium]|nr:M48 family metalloprotease [Myxococcales bacterium]MBK7194648.1 M48 family metalloprotease [Myxococcales bacterium]MBP6842248.1 M48 family metalloprotease [Kofleriaceae bacterium]
MHEPRVDWLRSRIEAEYVVERDGWAGERVDRVTAELQRDVPVGERLDTLVLWMNQWTAFTGPGHTIYVSRRLLETLPTDAAAAFVVAHELAHHRLGHLPRLSPGWRAAPKLALAMLQRLVHTPGRERDADLRAIELCIAAGYDVDDCLVALARMEHEALDWGDVDGVIDDVTSQRTRRSHPAVRRRVADIQAHVAAMARGHRLADELRTRAAARRRTLAIAGGVAATVAIALITRRPPRGLL